MNETVEHLEGDRSVISVDVRINNRDFLSRLYPSELVDELQRRSFDRFAEYATDSEIKKEFESRELTDSQSLRHAPDDDIFTELEHRGLFVLGEDAVEKVGNMIDKINQKRATIEDIYTLLENITGKLICR